MEAEKKWFISSWLMKESSVVLSEIFVLPVGHSEFPTFCLDLCRDKLCWLCCCLEKQYSFKDSEYLIDFLPKN